MNNDIILSLEAYARQLMEDVEWSCSYCGEGIDKTNYFVIPGSGLSFCIPCVERYEEIQACKIVQIQSRPVIFPPMEDVGGGDTDE